MRDRKWQQRITLFLGIFLSFGMVASVVLPLISTQMNLSQPQVQATRTPAPTQPAPPETSTINFDSTYLHPSGLFTAAIPSGYVLTNEFNTTGEAQVTMENTDALSVLEIRVIRPTADVSLETTQGLGDQFTQDWLSASWRGYSPWSEDARRVEDDKLIMDFSLASGGQDYVARQVAFTDGTWIYTMRVVSPSNASDAMRHVLDNEVDSFQTIERFVGSSLEWSGYFDDSVNHLIRFPGEWAVIDSGEGLPASVAGDTAQLRVETAMGTIDSETAAQDYVAGLRSNITVLSVEAVEQYGNSGYRVAYSLPNVDGANQSGAVLILNDGETAHIANLLLEDVADTDLNMVDVSAEETAQNLKDARELLGTFSIFPDLDVANS